MTKTPQQIRNEVEKEIEEASFCDNCNKSKSLCECNHANRYDYVLWKGMVQNIADRALTEYDKSMVEREAFTLDIFEEIRRICARIQLNDLRYSIDDIYSICNGQILNRKELISKIGNNSEVEK